jgi:hypothetical protein
MPPRRRRGDGLQSGNACPHDENLCGGDRARSRHHHRQGAVIFGCGVDHGLIAGEICLRRQNIHHLRPRDARHELHGESRYAGVRHGFDVVIASIRVHHGNDGGALPAGLELGAVRAPHFQDDVGGFGVGRRADFCASGFKIRVGHARAYTGALFNNHAEAKARHFFDGLRRSGNARLGGVCLFRYEYHLPHGKALSSQIKAAKAARRIRAGRMRGRECRKTGLWR